MKKIRIALGSNDGENVWVGHMGMAKDFYVYDVSRDRNLSFVEKRKNTSPNEEGKHGVREKMKAVMDILKDADVIIGKTISPNFVRIAVNTKLQPVVIRIDKISEIMKAVVKCFSEICSVVEERQKGNRSKEIPELGKKDLEKID